MTTKLAKWASEHDQIIKSRLSYGHQAKSLLSEAGLAYDWLIFNGYLGNVGLTDIPQFALCGYHRGLFVESSGKCSGQGRKPCRV